MAGKTFIDVLESQIRADLRAEIEAEVRARLDREQRQRSNLGSGPARPAINQGAADRLEVWLSAHVDKTFFSTTDKARRGYGFDHMSGTQKTKRTAKSQEQANTTHHQPLAAESRRNEPTVTITRIEDLCRLELLRRHGARLGETFSLSELKTAWRQAALKTHPDRFAQADMKTQTRMAAVFREIAATVEELEALFTDAARAA